MYVIIAAVSFAKQNFARPQDAFRGARLKMCRPTLCFCAITSLNKLYDKKARFSINCRRFSERAFMIMKKTFGFKKILYGTCTLYAAISVFMCLIQKFFGGSLDAVRISFLYSTLLFSFLVCLSNGILSYFKINKILLRAAHFICSCIFLFLSYFAVLRKNEEIKQYILALMLFTVVYALFFAISAAAEKIKNKKSTHYEEIYKDTEQK